MEDDLQLHAHTLLFYWLYIYNVIINNDQKAHAYARKQNQIHKHATTSLGHQVYIIAPLSHARYLFTLTSPDLKAMSAQALSSSTILFVSSGPAGALEGGHQIVSEVKKKGTDLLLNWPHSEDSEYQVIELIHAVFPCLGKMICTIVCLLQLIKGKNVSGMLKREALLKKHILSNVLLMVKEKNNISTPL